MRSIEDEMRMLMMMMMMMMRRSILRDTSLLMYSQVTQPTWP